MEVECSIGESLACVEGKNSKPHDIYQVVGLGNVSLGWYRYSQFGTCLSTYAYTIGLELEMLQMY